MLSYILGLIDEFQRKHGGRRPQVVYLNPRHMHELMAECPDLFNQDTAIPLGFRIVIVSENELPHPKAVWLPHRRPVQRPKAHEGTELIAWAEDSRKS